MRSLTRRDPSARVDDAILLFTLERTLDAVAEGEIAALGLGVTPVVARLRALLETALTARQSPG